MRILLLLFCLSCRLPLFPHVVDCLRILRTFCIATKKPFTVPLDPHIVYCLNIYKTFVVLITNKPRLFTVVVFFYHTFFNNAGKRCVFFINQNIGKCDSLGILLLLFFTLSFTAGPITFAPILCDGCFKKSIDCWFICHSFIIVIFQVKNTLHQKVSRIYCKY